MRLCDCATVRRAKAHTVARRCANCVLIGSRATNSKGGRRRYQWRRAAERCATGGKFIRLPKVRPVGKVSRKLAEQRADPICARAQKDEFGWAQLKLSNCHSAAPAPKLRPATAQSGPNHFGGAPKWCGGGGGGDEEIVVTLTTPTARPFRQSLAARKCNWRAARRPTRLD